LTFPLSTSSQRHLNESQKGILALRIEPLLAKEAAGRRKATQFKGGKPPVTATGREPRERHTGEATTQAAKVVGVSGRTVQRAKKLAKARRGRRTRTQETPLRPNDDKGFRNLDEADRERDQWQRRRK